MKELTLCLLQTSSLAQHKRAGIRAGASARYYIVVNNYMYDMGIATLAEDGLSLRVPNKFVLSLLLEQLKPLAERTKTSRLIQNAGDAGRRSKAILDFLQEIKEVLDVFP